ncbi:MAG: hypothetical protein AB7Y46_08685 [Armatimonadota bacterium]
MNAELMQQIIALAARRAINMMSSEGGLQYMQRAAPDDAALVNGVIIDGQFTPVCLFDDEATGFDNEEAGFA